MRAVRWCSDFGRLDKSCVCVCAPGAGLADRIRCVSKLHMQRAENVRTSSDAGYIVRTALHSMRVLHRSYLLCVYVLNDFQTGNSGIGIKYNGYEC